MNLAAAYYATRPVGDLNINGNSEHSAPTTQEMHSAVEQWIKMESIMEKIHNLLKQAGYFEERKVDITNIRHMYDEYGYRYTARQIQFIEKYAYLEIHYIHPIWEKDMLLQLDPIKAQKVISMDVVEKYNQFLQDDLLIIGEVEAETMTLFLSSKGFYFGGFDDCLINWGDSFETMLYKLASGKKGDLQIIE